MPLPLVFLAPVEMGEARLISLLLTYIPTALERGDSPGRDCLIRCILCERLT